MYQFTTDWFSSNIQSVSTSLADVAPRRILEIGSWEGRSAVWFLNAFPDAHLTCVDTWEGSVENTPDMVSGVYDRFCHNIGVAGAGDRVTIARGSSESLLYGLEPESFDVVYVDGDHHAFAALRDIVMSWGLLRSGGVLLVDDYGFGDRTADPNFPAMGIDAFLKLFESQYERIFTGYQVHLKKI